MEYCGASAALRFLCFVCACACNTMTLATDALLRACARMCACVSKIHTRNCARILARSRSERAAMDPSFTVTMSRARAGHSRPENEIALHWLFPRWCVCSAPLRARERCLCRCVTSARRAPCRCHVQTEPALRQYARRVCYVSNIHERHGVRSSARQPCHERADVGDSRDCVPVQRVCARDVRRAIRRREDAPRDSHAALTGRLHGPHVRRVSAAVLLCCAAAAAVSAVRCCACLLPAVRFCASGAALRNYHTNDSLPSNSATLYYDNKNTAISVTASVVPQRCSPHATTHRVTQCHTII